METIPAQALKRALWLEFGRYRHASKRLAQVAGIPQETAWNWIHGRTMPTAESLVMLMASCEPVAQAINGAVAELRAQNRRYVAARTRRLNADFETLQAESRNE